MKVSQKDFRITDSNSSDDARVSELLGGHNLQTEIYKGA